MNKTLKTMLIVAAVFIALAIMFVVWSISVVNSAYKQEESILSAQSSITIEIKKRNDAIVQLVQVVEQSESLEQTIVDSVTSARDTYTNSGDISGLTTSLNAVFEAYPDIKTVELYNTLMLSISQHENQIGRSRENFNSQVKTYKQHTRVFPNSLFLSINGYEAIEVDYLEEDVSGLDITNLFGE